MHKLLRAGVLSLATLSAIVSCQPGDDISSLRSSTASHIKTSATTTSASSVVPHLGHSTCVSRTANYITHTLPQQCLRTDRVAANATRSTTLDEPVHANEADRISGESAASQPAEKPTLSDAQIIGAGDAQSVSDPVTRLGSNPETTHAVAPTASSGDTNEATATADTDSPLDNANFLSFEEWKRQNQAKAEHAADPANVPFGGDRQRPINNALDSLGEEGEIELDFSGFGNAASSPRQQQAAYRTAEGAATASTAPETYTPRSKDAGKTCKERTNYASFDCAATVLKTNPECKSASSVLVENKDSYMLNTCTAGNKFFIVELCNDILVDTVVLANFEFFSSIFRQFRVSVSDRYPVKMEKWKDLGTFEARNTREVQAFLIKHPQIWARYLRIEFLSHYGSEYYCPVSLLRVHGTTMLEEIRPEEDSAAIDDLSEDETLQAEVSAVTPISQEPLTSTNEADKGTVQAMPPAGGDISIMISESEHSMSEGSELSSADGSMDQRFSPRRTSEVDITNLSARIALPQDADATCAANITSTAVDPSSKPLDPVVSSQDVGCHPSDAASRPSLSEAAFRTNTLSEIATEPVETTNSTYLRPSNTSIPNSGAKQEASHSATPSQSSSVSMADTSPETADLSGQQSESIASAQPSATNSSRSNSVSASSAPSPQPSTQESFFKSIHKRLQQLEANSTLSLQYIEEQSRILRDAFMKVEKRQISATTTFLTNLNETVLTELRGFRQAYDQLWQSTVIELEGQREHYQLEMFAISTRLTLVADELLWQKRLGIIQSTLVLLCLGFVLFTRGGSQGYFEVPLMQQAMNKSQTSLPRPNAQAWESPPASPSPENRSPVSLFRRKLLWRSITEPTGGNDSGTDSRPGSKDGLSPLKRTVDVRVEPPTPDGRGVLTPESEYAVDDNLVIDGNRPLELLKMPQDPASNS